MAGSKGPPKSKHGGGRPKGSTDETRDYRAAVAKMGVLIAAGISERKACRIIGKELNIPSSTLRNHLQGRTGSKPGLILNLDNLPLEVLTAEEAQEIRRQGEEKRLQRETEKTKRQAQTEARQKRDRLIELLRQANSYPIPRSPKKPQ